MTNKHSLTSLLIKYIGIFYRKIPWQIKGKGFFQKHVLAKLLRDKKILTIVKLMKPKERFFLCNLDDWLSWQVYNNGYNLGELDLERTMLSKIKPSSIVLDIGANTGYYTIVFSKLANKGRVYAFEPMSFQQNLLAENIKINKSQNITLIKKIVSDQNTQQKIYFSNYSNTGASSLHIKTKTYEYVNSITLDDFYKKELSKYGKHIDLIKIDVEGHERNVLNGMTKLLSEKLVNYIFIEILKENLINNSTTPLQIVSFLAKFGYDGFKIENSGLSPYDLSDQSLVMFKPK